MTSIETTPTPSRSTWVRDASFQPPVWRRGIWSFQLHEVYIAQAACCWALATALAVGLPKSALWDSVWWGCIGVNWAIFGTILAAAEVVRWVALMAGKLARSSERRDVGVITTAGLVGYVAVFVVLAAQR